ncbi:Glycerophosphodiester phosphodiesterase domain-containing protein 5 [Asimina triloba]
MQHAFNIAHRGSSGELPEETSAAYVQAIEEGADFIEADVLATKDASLICFHDLTLDDTTDVSEHTEFINRRKTYEVQGANITGWFVVDFTLEELKMLRVRQRFKFRDQQYNAQDAPRVVGIYPELKNPVFINQHLNFLNMEHMVEPNESKELVKWRDGKKFEDHFVETLNKYGYKGTYSSGDWLKQPIFIQSFAPTSLVYMSNLTNSPQILLIDDVTVPAQDTNQSYWEITSDDYFRYISNYVVGIGPWKDTLVPPKSNYLATPTDLVSRAHSHNLQVHPYTYRNEYMFLHWNFCQDPYKEYDYWINTIGVDGLFTDFTGSLHMFQEWQG